MKSELSNNISKEAKLIIKQLKKGELFIQDEWITDSFGEEYELFWAR